MDTKIKLESGKMLNITMLPTKEAIELLAIVSAELQKVQIKADLNREINTTGKEGTAEVLKSMLFDSGTINTFKDLLFQLLGSKKLNDFLFETAFRRCLYDMQPITYETFDEGATREDFIPVCKEVLLFNLRPFFKSLRSVFFQTRGSAIPTQK
jgi:DNA segregation ATPase FtsK/SpoIIIE-like protein